MIETLRHDLARAEEAGEDVGVASFLSVASRNTTHAAWILACAISLTEAEIAKLLTSLWPDLREPERAAAELGTWPFIEKGENGWRVSATRARLIAAHFRRTDASKFRQLHELLVEQEQQREREADEDENWFIRGRIAFYLAGVDQQKSINEFGHEFEQSPLMDRTLCRMWLSSLVIRQADLLSERSREVGFFRAFRLYVEGRLNDALEQFEHVISSSKEDLYEAIALHLAGFIERRRNPGVALPRLERSVVLSSKLNLLDNEIMARNSLVWALIDHWRQTSPETTTEKVESAHRYADENLVVALRSGVPILLARCRETAAAVEWLWSVARVGIQESRSRTKAILAALRESKRTLLALHDYDGAVHSANYAAQILVDLGEPSGDYSSALAEIGDILEAVNWVTTPVPSLVRLGKTVGSICGRASAEQSQTAHALLNRINQIRQASA